MTLVFAGACAPTLKQQKRIDLAEMTSPCTVLYSFIHQDANSDVKT